jgi:hypothetical protein
MAIEATKAVLGWRTILRSPRESIDLVVGTYTPHDTIFNGGARRATLPSASTKSDGQHLPRRVPLLNAWWNREGYCHGQQSHLRHCGATEHNTAYNNEEGMPMVGHPGATVPRGAAHFQGAQQSRGHACRRSNYRRGQKTSKADESVDPQAGREGHCDAFRRDVFPAGLLVYGWVTQPALDKHEIKPRPT